MASVADTTVGYIVKLAHGGKCSTAKAYEIELASEEVARKNRILKKVSGASLVRDPKKYKAFIAKVNGVEQRAAYQ